MSLKFKNENYAAVVVEIKTLLPLAGCDFVQAAIIMGNQVIVSKDTKIGDFGLYFPLETQLSEVYLKVNNLYRKSEMNEDPQQKGYFEENGRIRCVKFKGHKSEGLFMPLTSLDNINFSAEQLSLGDCFDELNGVEICRKYVIKHTNTPGLSGSKNDKKSKKYESKLVDNQFRFHQDTSMLYKNLHRINPNSLISITYKVHGTSGISSYVICKRFIPMREKIGAFIHNIYTNIVSLGKQRFKLEITEYDYIYASRKVIKNEKLNPTAEHFYNTNIWEIAHNELKDFLQKGMTFYYEIVGFLPNGGAIQKDYDYGCAPMKHVIYIYRITQTNVDGKVFEFSAKQVQDFCVKSGLKAVPQVYYGFAKGLLDRNVSFYENLTGEEFSNEFLTKVKFLFNDHDCYICSNKVPEEGVVIRIENTDFEAYKAKSNRFYERETKLLDQGIEDIENIN